MPLYDKYDRAWCDEHKYFPNVMYLGPNEGPTHCTTIQKAVFTYRLQNTPKLGLLGSNPDYRNGQIVEISQAQRESPIFDMPIQPGQVIHFPTVAVRQLQKISEYLYTNDYAVTEHDVRSVANAHGPSCETCMNYLRLLNFHLDVFQAAWDLKIQGLQLVAMEKFAQVMDSASARVLYTIVSEVFERRWPADETDVDRYRIEGPSVGFVTPDYRADLVVPACVRYLMRLRIRQDLVMDAGRLLPDETNEVERRMNRLREMIPDFDHYMDDCERRWTMWK